MTNPEKLSQSHNVLYLDSRNRMWFNEMIDFDSRVKGAGINTTQGVDLNQVEVQESSFKSKIESKSKNWCSHYVPIKGMWHSKIGGSCSRFIGWESMLAQ